MVEAVFNLGRFASRYVRLSESSLRTFYSLEVSKGGAYTRIYWLIQDGPLTYVRPGMYPTTFCIVSRLFRDAAIWDARAARHSIEDIGSTP